MPISTAPRQQDDKEIAEAKKKREIEEKKPYIDQGYSEALLNTYIENANKNDIQIPTYLRIATGKDKTGKAIPLKDKLLDLRYAGIINQSFNITTDGKLGNVPTIEKGSKEIPSGLIKTIYTTLADPSIFVPIKEGVNEIITRNLFFSNDPEKEKRAENANESKKNAEKMYAILSSGAELSNDEILQAADRIKQGLEVEEVADILQQQADTNITTSLTETTTPSTADVTTTPSTGDVTPGTTTDTGINFSQQIRDKLTELGIVDAFAATDINDLANRWKKGETTLYELTSFFKGTPEYQSKMAEESRTRAAEEGTAARAELGRSLEQQSTKYLREQAAPALEQMYKGLGGTNRSSLGTAAARAMRDVAQTREQTLLGAGIEAASQQAGYTRQDYGNQMQQMYQNYLNEYNTQSQINAQNRGLQIQQSLRPQQLADIRMANLYNERQQATQRDWQSSMLNLQRKWQVEDRDYTSEQNKKAGLLGFIGNVAGIGASALMGGFGGAGKTFWGGFAKGGLSGLTGGQYNPWQK